MQSHDPLRIQVYLWDDDPEARRLTRAMLEGEGQVAVIGEGGPAEGGLEELRRLAPDVLLADPGGHDQAAFDHLADEVTQALPGCALVLYSFLPDDVLAARCDAAGAAGYLRKGTSPEQVSRAVVNARERGAAPGAA